ncbi:hypothetical protein A3B52_02225 [Candidatus Curtissbacteria bacterium RIFCSPLOWO2_01_FULL_41_28]|uniref:OmpR/PhoB-type domain-containing protein n=1 Tax=Candidatus Curtissbacteria bacterium RIFOXYA1_FULL_41_14 TaxID=1797737 RepID=A0A1F5HD22_9BACT|nr:MAG: hypothetical protein A2683_02505 [Candidatus Curtissbacteria bacterium RIFCSPHIGHO2_01_FULL_34_40]OGD91743.1 MAG: hypothetical protein A3E14_02940 [Candidatus Curtissbacteria bacterium RIFCSPHIGHO2_12_FULL_41_13]OGD95230.1 MAG: hypothetical protein A3B52_02225 [Candidatus Curtissbacteria bacterium RIFCSPLOWO2_01_FULL_41_28]OGE01952.1 MAG: hypothetical protein A2196_05070 [Candidatus Curtissbacteria bacterium RIFOXYA1_FULL_41_14]OGE05910.1 MAG: hypothetical protein A2362_00570 [Candidatu
MGSPIIEVKYPIKFREEDAKILGEHVRLRHNVNLIGAKRVGIGDFLNFFLYHKDIARKYIDRHHKHLLIPVDLNDLVEIKLFAFWTLTFKRIVDAVGSLPVEPSVKKQINGLFLTSIQESDLFLTVENLRKSLIEIAKTGILPTIFWLRFDRISEITPIDFFANLQGLREATGQKLCFVLTSYREIGKITPRLTEKLLPIFIHNFYIKPAGEKDAKVILHELVRKYHLKISGKLAKKIIEVSGGHAQYLYLTLIILAQSLRDQKVDEKILLELISGDERLILQSEEIWDSLFDAEKDAIGLITEGKKVGADLRFNAKYIWETGLVLRKFDRRQIFSPIFGAYVRENGKGKVNGSVELTKKENLLFSLLLASQNEVCEREKIIEAVWAEYEDLGVSDWTIDKLVARLRNKLKEQGSDFSVITVKTRGYKLVSTKPNPS